MHEQDPHGRLREFVGQLIQQKGADSSLLDTLPKRWEKFADVALLPRTAFTEEGWNDLRGPELWSAIASALKVKRVGKIGEIVKMIGWFEEKMVSIMGTTSPNVCSPQGMSMSVVEWVRLGGLEKLLWIYSLG